MNCNQQNPLITPNKFDYAVGKRPPLDCILCGIVRHDERVINLEVNRTQNFIVVLNLYPYNPGHLLIFPIQHKLHIHEMTVAEASELFELEKKCMTVLDKLYRPHGYNVGYNIGKAAGASITHLHLHIVPRYENEAGILDILSGTRVLVEDPIATKERIQKAFAPTTESLPG